VRWQAKRDTAFGCSLPSKAPSSLRFAGAFHEKKRRQSLAVKLLPPFDFVRQRASLGTCIAVTFGSDQALR
jgi:hypothetical protein